MAIHFSLRVVGGSEVMHSWRQCKRSAVVLVVDPGSRHHRAPLCRQHWNRLTQKPPKSTPQKPREK